MKGGVIRYGLQWVAVFAVSAFVARIGFSPEEPEFGPKVSVSPKLGERRPAAGGKRAVDTRMARIRGAGSEAERVRAAVALVEELPSEELEAWLEKGWFNFRDGAALTVFRECVAERWRREDPEGYFEWAAEKDARGAIAYLGLVATDDPQQAFEMLERKPLPRLEIAVLAELAARDPALALERWKRLVERFPDEVDENQGLFLLTKLAEADPDALEAATAEMPERFRTETDRYLLKARLQASFGEELRRLIALPDGWEKFPFSEFGEELLAHAGELPDEWKRQIARRGVGYGDVEDSRAWLSADLETLGFDDEEIGWLREGALKVLVERELEITLGDMDMLGLSRAERDYLIEYASRQTGLDPAARERMLAGLSGADRELAAELFAKQDEEGAVADAFGRVSEPEKPRTVAGWMEGLAAGEIRSSDPFASNDWGSWTAAQQREMTANFGALPEEAKDEVTNTLLGASAGEMVGSDFAAQMLARAASRDEETFDRWRLTSAVQNHAINWMLEEPDAAAKWVDTLPWNHVGREARREMVRAWGGYDPESARRWVERMPADERERMQGVLEAGM